MTKQEITKRLNKFERIKRDLKAYLQENCKPEMPSRYWEPGSEDGPGVLPEEQWIPDSVELPFE